MIVQGFMIGYMGYLLDYIFWSLYFGILLWYACIFRHGLQVVFDSLMIMRNLLTIPLEKTNTRIRGYVRVEYLIIFSLIERNYGRTAGTLNTCAYYIWRLPSR